MMEITLTIIIYLRCKDSSFITCGYIVVTCRHIDQMESRQNSYETSYHIIFDDGMKADDTVKNYFGRYNILFSLCKLCMTSA